MSTSVGGRAEEATGCLDAGQLVELARGSLKGTERARAMVHLGACSDCAEVVRLWTGVDATSIDSSGASVAGRSRGPAAPGDVLAGKFQVDRVLGIGGMGMVVAATHLQLGQVFALKLMLPTASESQESVARFLREARAAAEVKSEHVVRVFDVGALDDGTPFMVMEFLRGMDFARLLKAQGPLPVADVAGYVLQACDAVAEAHALGIVHRDLKPANLFLTARVDGSPLVKVLDFGISKVARRGAAASATLTRSRSVMGTPLYMSPEQLQDSRAVGPQADVWALGCVLYELLAGRPPFLAETAQALGALIAAGATPRVRDARPLVPPALEEVIARCLEKEPGARFAAVGELAARIAPFAPVELTPLVARIAGMATVPSSPSPFAGPVSSERPPRISATGGGLARSRSTGDRQSRVGPLVVSGAVLAIGVAAWAASGMVGHPSDPKEIAAASLAHATEAPPPGPAPSLPVVPTVAIPSPAAPVSSASATAASPSAVVTAPATAPPVRKTRTAAPSTPPAPTASSSARRPTAPAPAERDAIE